MTALLKRDYLPTLSPATNSIAESVHQDVPLQEPSDSLRKVENIRNVEQPSGTLVLLDAEGAAVQAASCPNCFSLDISISDLDPEKFDQIRTRFEIEDVPAVSNFLTENEELLSFLPKVELVLRKSFPKEPIQLNVLDPPADIETTEILVLVMVKDTPEESLKKLAEFQGWWLDNSDGLDSKIIVDIRYQ